MEENRFYAPSYNRLNNPFETLVFTDTFNQQASLFSRFIGQSIDSVKEALDGLVERKNEVGIYSLSKTHNDELLWAHYANSHYGFCIEYDLEALLKIDKNDSDMHSFSVSYSNIPPQITLNDGNGKDLLTLITKIAGTKSAN